MIGDASKAHDRLGWKPDVDFDRLVKLMVTHDMESEAAKAGIEIG